MSAAHDTRRMAPVLDDCVGDLVDAATGECSRRDLASSGVDARSQRRAAARTKVRWSLLGDIAAVCRFASALVGHTHDGFGGLAELRATDAARRDLQNAVDEIAKSLLRQDNASFREIGIALGISRQAAAERYRDDGSRRPGGQPSNLR